MRLLSAAVAATLCVVSGTFAVPATAQSLDIPSGTYRADPRHTSVIWKVSHFGFSTYTGMVERDAIDATVELDAGDVTASRVEVTVDGSKIATLHPGEEDFDGEIESDMFLNTVETPAITFKSTEIQVTGDKTADIVGEMTLRGQTHPLTLSATLNQAGMHPMTGAAMLGVSATGSFDRTLFGVDALAGPIGQTVTIEIEAEFAHEG